MKNYLRVFLGLALFLGVVQGQAKFQAKVDSELLSGSGLRTVIVSIKDKNNEKTSLKNRMLDLGLQGKSLESSMTEENRQQRANLVTMTLKDAHVESQSDVLSFLQGQKSGKAAGAQQMEITPLWITNQIILKNVDSDFIKQLASHPDVKQVKADTVFAFDDPKEPEPVPPTVAGKNNKQDRPLEWGVRKVGADKVWATGNMGEGVVVGIIDTGCTLEHEALTGNWKSKNGWLDPTSGTKTPTDVQGHGSHCAGSILGSKASGVGVAPGAQWIACQGCQSNGCSGSALLACGQFMLCPSGNNASCDAPHIVSNSWGSQNFFGNDRSYDEVIKNWRMAGIIPVIAIGNSGQRGCRSTGNPGDNPDAIGIGATTEAGKMATFSSLGPTKNFMNGTLNGKIKPDFSAPGEDIISVKYNTKNEYTKMSGTSMATPHASGVIALMMSDEMRRTGQVLSYNQIYKALQKGSVPVTPFAKPYPNFRDCGSKSEKEYPNNHAGYGFMDAPSVIRQLTQ